MMPSLSAKFDKPANKRTSEQPYIRRHSHIATGFRNIIFPDKDKNKHG